MEEKVEEKRKVQRVLFCSKCKTKLIVPAFVSQIKTANGFINIECIYKHKNKVKI